MDYLQQDPRLHQAISLLTDAITSIAGDTSIYLHGSVATGDFHLGWSDIDILALTHNPISLKQAEALLILRAKLCEAHPNNPYFSLFEGGILSLEAFLSGEITTCVYWSAGNERISATCDFTSLSRWELLHRGVLLTGGDVRSQISEPTFFQMRSDVEKHLATVRRVGKKPGRSLYAFGWMFDIARGLYTLHEGGVASKTEAGLWVLENELCPDEDTLELALRVRKDPLAYKERNDILTIAASLGPSIMRFSGVLQDALDEK